jgi:glycine hydroxymethyltransferase
VTSGVRIGTPAVTTAGMKEAQMVTLGLVIVEILRNRGDELVLKQLRESVVELVDEFPAYPAGFPGYV